MQFKKSKATQRLRPLVAACKPARARTPNSQPTGRLLFTHNMKPRDLVMRSAVREIAPKDVTSEGPNHAFAQQLGVRSCLEQIAPT